MRASVQLLMRAPYAGVEMLEGLARLGYSVQTGPLVSPTEEDLLVLWNRYPHAEEQALAVEKAGGRVIVVENGYFGRNHHNGPWYALSIEQHNGAGWLPNPSIKMWDRIGYPEEPWRTGGKEIVVLAQRGLGSALCRSPDNWAQHMVDRLKKRTDRPIRIREHPGPQAVTPSPSLERDIANAHAVVTWGSSAALKAIFYGVPVFWDFSDWIGRYAASPLLTTDLEKPYTKDRNVLKARLATAMWSLKEIQSGSALECLLRS